MPSSRKIHYSSDKMCIIIGLAAVLCSFHSVLARNPETRIIGGWDADITQSPYYVKIEMGHNNSRTGGKIEDFCGSTIIDQQWILTAAHCVPEPESNEPIWLVMGVDDLEDTEDMPSRGDLLPRVDLSHCHPEYRVDLIGPAYKTYIKNFNDICLLRTDHVLEFGKYVNRAVLPWYAYDQKIEGRQMLFTGFGKTGLYPLRVPHKLKAAKLKVMTHNKCESLFNIELYPGHYNRELDICTMTPDEVVRDGCGGDSGGGLVYEDSITLCPIVVGVLSDGNTRHCNESSRFIKISAYRAWIEQTIQRFTPSTLTSTRVNYPARNRIE